MKATGIIGLVRIASCLLLLAPALFAQDDQPVRHRSSRPISATSPASVQNSSRGGTVPQGQFRPAPIIQSRPTAPIPLPARPPQYQRRFDRERDVTAGRAPTGAPNRAGAESPTFKPGATARTSPSRSAARKIHRKTTRANESQAAAGKSPAQQNAAAPAKADEHEAERANAAVSQTPAVATAGPTHAPEAAPILTPASTPPMMAPAPAFVRPVQAPPAPRQTQPTRPQRPVLNNLSEDERTRFHTAHQTALHDPNLAASRTRYLNARKEFREKLRDALLKADPSMQPILEKIRQEKPEDR
jgi:hypothetical protein